MIKNSMLAATAAVCLLLCQSWALAQDGPAAYKTVDSGFSSALKAEAAVGGTADIAAYWA